MVNNKDNFNKGVLLILGAAVTAAIGQLLWKFGTDSANGWIFYIIGFAVAGFSAILMMLSFQFGEVSILQPLMSIGYVVSIILGFFFFNEPITLNKIIGTVFVIIGASILAIPDKVKKVAVIGKKAGKKAKRAVSKTAKKTAHKTAAISKSAKKATKSVMRKRKSKKVVK